MIQPIIAVTGTKGKTSIVRMIDFVLQHLHDQVVRVDTTGAYLNSQQVYSDDDSRSLWGYASANLPGRFIALHGQGRGPSVLECTLFCARTGLGYKQHDVGIFSNVYEDHIGAFPDIATADDIARMKRFVFTKIRSGGTAVFNADDGRVTAQTAYIPEGVTKIAVTLRPDGPLPEHDYLCTLKDENIIITDARGKQMASALASRFAWLKQQHNPSRYNALLVFAALYTAVENEQLPQAIKALEAFTFAPEGGRMAELETASGVKVILDFAHEKVSLKEIALYARTLCRKAGKVIGVVRLAPSRPEALVSETAQYIYNFYDEFVVYDKVDGYYRTPHNVKGYKCRQEAVGQTAKTLASHLQAQGTKSVITEIREDNAIQTAVKNARKGDVIVYIVGDDAKRSLGFLKKCDALKE